MVGWEQYRFFQAPAVMKIQPRSKKDEEAAHAALGKKLRKRAKAGRGALTYHGMTSSSDSDGAGAADDSD